MIHLIDTFGEIEEFYLKYRNASVDDKLQGWLRYISSFPELKEKCINDYENAGYKWEDVARKMALPLLESSFDKMDEGHFHILECYNDVAEVFNQVFDLADRVSLVVYYGLCNSAGWATTYNGKQAVLLGIEKMAELGWCDKDSVVGLVCHELCHVAHNTMRRTTGLEINCQTNSDKAVWSLYIEGFAQRYEQVLVGDDEFYHQNKDGWLDWCRGNHSKLCNQYLASIQNNTPTSDFYGDWNHIDGYSDAGYYLGRCFIKDLQRTLKTEALAILDSDAIKLYALEYLQRNASP